MDYVIVNNYECTTLHHFCNLCRNEKVETCRECMSDFDFVLRFLGRFLGLTGQVYVYIRELFECHNMSCHDFFAFEELYRRTRFNYAHRSIMNVLFFTIRNTFVIDSPWT